MCAYKQLKMPTSEQISSEGLAFGGMRFSKLGMSQFDQNALGFEINRLPHQIFWDELKPSRDQGETR